MAIALALVLPAYLVGTFPTAVLVARAGGRDVLTEGSGNPGASNVYRLMGLGPALLVFVGDVLKGALPALAGLAAWGHGGAYLLGAAAVVGHVFPVTRRLRGGRGVATGAGMALALYPVVIVVLAALWLLVAKGAGRASLASLVATVALPVLVGLSGRPAPEVVALAAVALLVLARHLGNLRRLLHGDELLISGDSSARPGDAEAT